MDSIYFEKQESLMCGQHALNMLLQSDYFSAQDLAEIARRLDSLERHFMDREAPSASRSENMNDYGFFSIQVLTEALKNFDIEICPLSHPSMAHIRKNPHNARAFICNLREHWFVLRKFGVQWFELNSVKKAPRFISDTYLEIYIEQLLSEGYSIFVVDGNLPQSEADQIISLCPVVPPPHAPPQPKAKPSKIEAKFDKFFTGVSKKLGFDSASSSRIDDEDEQLAIALAASMESADQGQIFEQIRDYDEDAELQRAIEMSRQDGAAEQGQHGRGIANNEPREDFDADIEFISDIVEHPTQVTVDVQIEKKGDQSDAKNSSKGDGERVKAGIESRVQRPETSAGDGPQTSPDPSQKMEENQSISMAEEEEIEQRRRAVKEQFLKRLEGKREEEKK
ncbi:hypothetical protein WR25_07644 [Diploscapter pachys]|uniref:Ataxin-3 homolog n=1 Tax=Diploscapter pachys TaxID=2018661 RepID=A0A2A2LUX3_9BILA|nr:hypothetical protein WR25_07644 [Diploscapter pachys]